MHHCMNREELRQFIEFKTDQRIVENNALQVLIDGAESWQDELCCLNYLFSQVLERRLKKGNDHQAEQECINMLYQLSEHMSLCIQELDSEFVDYMLKCVRDRSLSLEEELIQIQNKLGEHSYDSTLRY